MRIALVTSGDPAANPRCGPLVSVLVRAGHQVTVVSPPVPAPLQDVDHRTVRPSRLDRWRRRLSRGGDVTARMIAAAAAATSPDLVYPLRARDVPIADAIGDVWALAAPAWPSPNRDYVWAGPRAQGLADPAPSEPPIAGGPIDIVARFTATSPARYLADGFERLGFEVERRDVSLDWGEVDPASAAVIFVESPYPALEVIGERHEGVPVLFWVHHGEHHQPANLRLAERYGADAVLLAHSWHLAHQYPVPVYTLPFGVPIELLPGGAPAFGDRDFDVAMVGAGLDASDGWYAQRGARVRAISARPSIRSFFRYGLPPAEMMAAYERARVVINDGGAQHHPITMRVFEALGAGAALATEPAPGLDTLFDEGVDYSVLRTADASEVESLLADPELPGRAIAAHRKALTSHTYEHRARRVLDIAATVARKPGSDGGEIPEPTGVAAIVDRDVEVQSIIVSGDVGDEVALVDRDVRCAGPGASFRPASFDAVILGEGGDPDVIALAREYVYVRGGDAGLVDAARRRLPQWREGLVDGWWRFDAAAGGYRVRPDDHPLR